MSSCKAKKDGQEERSGIWNGPDEDSPIKPTAAGAIPRNTKGANTMSIDMMNAKVNTYFELMAQIEQLQAEAEAIKDTLKGQMLERETEEVEGTGWRATWHNTNSSRFDTKRFKADHADLYGQYTVKSTVSAGAIL